MNKDTLLILIFVAALAGGAYFLLKPKSAHAGTGGMSIEESRKPDSPAIDLTKAMRAAPSRLKPSSAMTTVVAPTVRTPPKNSTPMPPPAVSPIRSRVAAAPTSKPSVTSRVSTKLTNDAKASLLSQVDITKQTIGHGKDIVRAASRGDVGGVVKSSAKAAFVPVQTTVKLAKKINPFNW